MRFNVLFFVYDVYALALFAGFGALPAVIAPPRKKAATRILPTNNNRQRDKDAPFQRTCAKILCSSMLPPQPRPFPGAPDPGLRQGHHRVAAPRAARLPR